MIFRDTSGNDFLSILSDLGVTLILIIISLPLPVFKLSTGDWYYGGLLFFYGWIEFLFAFATEGVSWSERIGYLSWLANPTLLAASILYLLRIFWAVLALSGIAFVVGLSSLLLTDLSLMEWGGGGEKSGITMVGIGFYVWLLALLSPGIGAFIRLRFRRAIQP